VAVFEEFGTQPLFELATPETIASSELDILAPAGSNASFGWRAPKYSSRLCCLQPKGTFGGGANN